MLYILKIDYDLKILTDFVAINFSEYLKSTWEKLYSKLNEEQSLRKVAKLLFIFLTASDEVEQYAKMMQSNSSDNCVHCSNVKILNLFYPELQLSNTKPMIKNKLRELLSELKNFKAQTILILGFKKRNGRKIFHSSIKLIVSDSDIDGAFISIHQSIMTKI